MTVAPALTTWQQARLLVLERDGYRCVLCKRTSAEVGLLHVHHLIPRSAGGSNHPDNLRTLCDGCHSKLHIRQHATLGRRWLLELALKIAQLPRLAQPITEQSLTTTLQLLGKDQFRPGQLDVILAALKGQSVLFVSPTGSGKSLCFQIPALLSPGYTLVLSPLKALMSDQVGHLLNQGIPVTYNNSSITPSERQTRYQLLEQGAIKLYYCTPKRFVGETTSEKDKQYHQKLRPSYLVIDEAHVAPNWGYSFYPEYRQLKDIRAALGNPPVIALTATADPTTQRRILELLNIPDAKIVTRPPNRPNISLIKKKISTNNYAERLNLIFEVITKVDGKTLIFVPTINSAKQLYEAITSLNPGYRQHLGIYHSERDSQDRELIEARFAGRNNPSLNVIIATSAFGMGIDIPNIRAVIHCGYPGSLDDYVQGIGRAGRDGQPSFALLLYTESDYGTQWYLKMHGLEDAGLNEPEFKQEQRRLRNELKAMDKYANQNHSCLRNMIERHFPPQSHNPWSAFTRLLLHLAASNDTKATSTPCCSNCHPKLTHQFS